MPLKDIIAVMVSTPGVEAAQSTHVIVYVVAAFLSVGLLVLLLMLVKWGLQWYLSWLPKADEWVHNIWRVKLAPHPVPNLMALGAFLIALLIFVPWIHSWLIVSDKLSEKDALEVANETRKTIAQIMAGMAAIVAFYFAWLRNYLTAQGQITDRFAKAVEQLGSDQISIRMGGIFALERIAKDSPEDHWTVMEVLTAFIREKSPANPKEEEKPDEAKKDKDDEEIPKLPNDIQAALTVIARRGNLEWEKENDKQIDLRGADLRRADLENAQLQGADMTGAQLQGASLIGAQLQRAELHNAQLHGAKLFNAKMQGAMLIKAQMQRADLTGAKLHMASLIFAQLQEAHLTLAYLQGANLTNAQLQKADLSHAYLQGADLTNAQLQGSYLMETQLQCAILTNAKLHCANLSGANLQGARINEAQLPGASLAGAQMQGAYLVAAQLQGSILVDAQLQGSNFGEANLEGCSIINTGILGANFSNCQTDGVLCKFDYSPDKTNWDEMILVATSHPGADGLRKGLLKTRKDVIEKQNNPPPIPRTLKTEKKRFVELNRELALTDSFIAERFIIIPGYFEGEAQPLFEEIAQHIKDTLNNNPNHPIRMELEARGRADLFKEKK